MRTTNRWFAVVVAAALCSGTARASLGPYSVFAEGLDQVVKAHGGGSRPALGSGGRRSVTYQERWLGLKRPVSASYQQAAGSTRVSRVVLRLPASVANTTLRDALRQQAGMPAGRAVRKAGHMKAGWAWHGVGHRLDSTKANKTLVLAPLPLRIPPALPNAVVLQDVSANVLGKGFKSSVLLAGIPYEPGEIWMKSLYLVVSDPKKTHGGDRVFALGFGGMYDSELLVRDFAGNGGNAILVSAPTGGSGGLSQYALVSLHSGVMKPLVDTRRLSGGPKFSVTFADGFKARVACSNPRGKWTLNLRPYRADYVSAHVYSASGKLIDPTTGAVDGVGLLKVRGTGRHPTLLATQSIWGTYHANTIGRVLVRWRWRNGALRIVGIRVRPL